MLPDEVPEPELLEPPPPFPSPTGLLCGLRWVPGAMRSSSFSMRKRFFGAGGGSACRGWSDGVGSCCDSMIGLLETEVGNLRRFHEAVLTIRHHALHRE